MERPTLGHRKLAEKYLDVAKQADSFVEYGDDLVRIEPQIIIVKTEQPSYDLTGLRAWKFSIKKRGTLDEKPEPIVWKSMTPVQLLMWAKTQKAQVLRTYLAAQGVEATGTIIYPLAALLYYQADELYRKANGTWPPLAHLDRERRIRLITQYKDTKGGMTDEEVIVQILTPFHHPSTHLSPKESRMPKAEKDAASKGESRAEIRARLLAEAEQENEELEESAESTENEEPEEEEPEAETTSAPKSRKATPSSEKDAIRGGKKKAAESEPPPAAPKKEKAVKPKAAKAAAEPEEEENEPMPKKSAAAKKSAPKAAKSNGGQAKSFPIGSTIKYTGTRVAKHTGKVGEVTGYRGEDGLSLKFKDGSTGSATVGAVELVKKGAGK